MSLIAVKDGVSALRPHGRMMLQIRGWALPILISLGIFSASASFAQVNAYWDVNGTNAGQGGTGTWSSSGVLWTTNSTNASANSGGPTGGGLFAVTNGAAAGQSGNYIFNFSGTAGSVKQGGAYEAVGINFLTSGYNWWVDAVAARSITTTNGVNLNGNALILSNGPTGVNSFTFASPAGITSTPGGSLSLKNNTAYVAGSTSFGVYLSGGTISSNIAINVDIGTGSRIFFGSQSSGGITINANVTNNSVSGVALNITNSASGVVALNGIISGTNGLILNNSSSGKISLTAANTYSGGTTLLSTNTGEIIYSNVASFGAGTITSSGNGSTNYIRSAVNNLDLTNPISIDAGNTLRMAGTTSSWTVTNSSQISGAGAFLYNNAGTLYLTGTENSFGGGVTLGSSGTLYFSKFGMSGANSSLGTNGTITVGVANQGANNGSLRWMGSVSEVSDKVINLASSTNGVLLLANGATNASLTLNGAITSVASGNKTITLAGYNTNTLTVNGLINEAGGTNSVTVGASSTGIVVLGNNSNNFSGGVTVTQSTSSQFTYLQVANIGNSGQNSPLGTAGTINFLANSVSNFLIFKYTGTGEVSDKTLNLAGTFGGVSLDQSGSGNLKFTSAMTATGVGAKTITLQGSTGGTGELAGSMTDSAGSPLSFSKKGSGQWTLSGNNNLTGGLTVTDGTLVLAGDNTGFGLVTINTSTNAKIKLMGLNALPSTAQFAGASSVATTGTLDIGAAGIYTFDKYTANNIAFTNSSGSASTITFTNGTNVLSSGGNGGRSVFNNSANLVLDFSGGFDISSTASDEATFNGAGDTRVRGPIFNTLTGIRSLNKSGAGTLRLYGTNTYNGYNKIMDGKLVMVNAKSLPTNSDTLLDGGQLKVDYVDANSDTLGNLQVTANSSIDAGTGTSGSTLKFASATNWTASRTLTVSSYYPTGARIYIVDTNGVPLSQIKLEGNTSAQATLASDGLLSFSVPKTDQTITFGALATKTYGDVGFSLSASASSGLTVSYASSDPSVVTVAGNTVTIVGAGTATITASQAGDDSYNPAPSVAQTLTVNKASQTITFGALANAKEGDSSITLNANASSGLTVSYASSNLSVATVAGNMIIIVGPGTTTITASQSGSGNYNPATSVDQTLTVTSAGPSFADSYKNNNMADIAPNGLSYLMNYAFGGSDTTTPKLPVQDTSDPTQLTLIAFVRTNDTGVGGVLSVKGQTNNGLSNWSTNTFGPSSIPADQSDAPAGTQKQVFSVPKSGDRLFLRLKATK